MPAKRHAVARPNRRPDPSTSGPELGSPHSAPATPNLRPDALHPDTILLAVVGMSPAVLTETIWALAHESEAVLPRRILAVTTIEGRNQIETQLFTPSPRFGGRTPWEALRDALAEAGHSVKDRLQFGTTGDDLRVFTAREPDSGRSRELADIRTAADNEAAADFLLDQVRQVVENPDTRLIASVAGGRKTMSALLYACMTLTGRETDRLTHVLVNEPFENAPGFFFPNQPGGDVPLRGNASSVSPAAARLELADVPFVPLRNLFIRELGKKAGTFSLLVETCREQVRTRAGKTLRVTVDTHHCRIEVNGHELAPSPREHVLLLFLARRAKHQQGGFPDYQNAVDPLNVFRDELRASRPAADPSEWRHDPRLNQPFAEEDLRRLIYSLKQKLRHRGGDAALLAACLPEKGRFSLEIEPALIFLK